jgi:hypothetical protein
MQKSTTLAVRILAITVPAIFLVIRTNAQLPAFPGADGAAANVTGGRGGIVYHVTKLDKNYSDTVNGTLRYGLNDANFAAGTKRTIVFDVGGTFWLGRYGAERGHYNGWDTQDRLDIGSNVTIAGQTAPGLVYIMGGVIKASKTNVIVRNVLVAPGYGMRSFEKPDDVPPTLPKAGDFPDAYVYDAFDISGQNVMIDHCTTVYATDETISCNELANNFTFQYCNVSQGQNYPQLDAESTSTNYTGHALGSLLQAGSNAKISVLNNLYAHQKGRLPRVGTETAKLTVSGVGAVNDFRNNVFYNWLSTAGTGANSQPSTNNFINNFYLAGPGGDNPVGGTNYAIGNAAGGTGLFSGDSTSTTRAYVNGNIKDTDKNGNPNNTSSADASFSSIVAMSAAANVNQGMTLKATNAFRNVLRYVGYRWWERDYDFTLGNTDAINTLDERIIYETYTGTGKIIAWADDPFNSDPNEGVEWRNMLAFRANTNTAAAPFNRPAGWDTDSDGMPDNWEIEHGLNPSVANNNDDFDNDGYTDLEEYLNDVAAWPSPGAIYFTGATNSRYALIYNWQVTGEPVNIAGLGTVTTSSRWQPSRYDTAVISNATVVVDAVGQNTGILRLTNNGTLNITAGWLKAGALAIGSGCTLAVQPAGALRLTGSGSITLSGGGTFTNAGTLDIMTWSGTLPAGFVNTGTVLDRSLIRVQSVVPSGADVQVNIQGYRCHNYQLQYSDDLSGGTWTNVGSPVAGADAFLALTHSGGAAAQQRFYRVAVD